MKYWLQPRSYPTITTVMSQWLAKACSIFGFSLNSLEKLLPWAVIANPRISEGVNHVSEVQELFPHYIKITPFMLLFFLVVIIIILR